MREDPARHPAFHQEEPMLSARAGPGARRRRRLLTGAGSLGLTAAAVAVLAGGTLAANSATPIKIGILSTCQGPFAPFYPETTAGARTALIQLTGAKPAGTGATSPIKGAQDRKSTRLNSSHEWISYAVFCLK